MNYLLLRQRVCRTLGIPTDDPSDEEYIMVGDLLNEGVRDILSRTRLHVRCVDIQLEAGKTSYEFDDNIIRIITMKVGNTELKQVDRSDLNGNTYCIPGHDRLVLGFTPATAQILEAEFIPRPTEMNVDTDDPADMAHGNIEQQFQPGLINYAIWHMGDTLDDTSSQSGERYRILYEGQDAGAGVGTNLGQIKRAVNRRAMSGSRERSPGDLEVFDSDPYLWIG